jgi:UPF0176 protein
MKMNKIILFYQYTKITNPEKFREEHYRLCEKLNLKGRVIVAKEGINATLEGSEENIDKYLKTLKSMPGFEDTHIKMSDPEDTTQESFPRLSVKVKKELVSLFLDEDVDPTKESAPYIYADELHQLFENKEEFYIIDMRNTYEHAVGYFKNSVFPQMESFKDLPQTVKDMEHLKNKTIVTVCTGGVRCEKASGYLLQQGFKNVRQLYGGIVTYMEKYPNQNFLGELYVFDDRMIMGFNMDDPNHITVGKCECCGETSNTFRNCAYEMCHRHFIGCEKCEDTEGLVTCKECLDKGIVGNLTLENTEEDRNKFLEQAKKSIQEGFEKIGLRMLDKVKAWDENFNKDLTKVNEEISKGLIALADRTNKKQLAISLKKKAKEILVS